MNAQLPHTNTKQTDSPIRDFISLSCEYSPLPGKYVDLVMDAVRAGGIGTVVALDLYFSRPVRRKTG